MIKFYANDNQPISYGDYERSFWTVMLTMFALFLVIGYCVDRITG